MTLFNDPYVGSNLWKKPAREALQRKKMAKGKLKMIELGLGTPPPQPTVSLTEPGKSPIDSLISSPALFNVLAPRPAAEPQRNSVDNLLRNPMLLNIMAQSGHSLTPGPSPIGVVGRAGIATAQQEQAGKRASLEDRLLRERIGLTNAQAEATQNHVPESVKASTELGKLSQDLANGVITPEDYQARREDILSSNPQRGFENEKVLREEFSKRSKGVSDSLQALSQAEALLATSQNPVAELAAFISLIKSIDNSTVREGELNNFSQVSGIISQLETLAGRAAGRGAFEPGVREDIEEAIKALRGNLEQMHGGFRDFYGSEAERHGLNRRGVVGGPIPQGPGPSPTQPGETFEPIPTPPSAQPQSLQPGAVILE